MKSNTIIFVNPVESISVQGRHLQMFLIEGKDGNVIPTSRMNKVREDDVPHQFKFPADFKNPTSLIYTGFEQTIPNPYKGMSVEDVLSEYGLGEKWAEYLNKIVLQPRITKQVFYEIKHAKDPGFYTNIKSENLSKGTYLEKLKVLLYPRPNRFTTESQENEIKIELVRLHKRIANSKDEVIPGVHNWYISQENEAEEQLAKKQEVIKKAIANLYLLQTSNSKFKNYQMAIILKDVRGENIAKGEMSPMAIDRTLDAYVQKDTKDQMFNVYAFIEKIEQLATLEGSIKFNLEYLIQQAINSNVFVSRDGYITWNSKSGTPNVSKWTNYDKMLAFFIKEYKNYNPKEKDATNWYIDLYNEVKSKGIALEFT